MENIVTSLKIRCARLGISLSSVTKEAGVNKDNLTRWKQKEPKSISTYRKLDEKLREKETAAGVTAERSGPTI